MEYPYLGQNTFDASCTLPGMESALQNCNIPCSYGDSNPFGQMAQGYRYNGVRSFPPASSMGSASCSMVPRPRDHPQPPMFPTGKYDRFSCLYYCTGAIENKIWVWKIVLESTNLVTAVYLTPVMGQNSIIKCGNASFT